MRSFVGTDRQTTLRLLLDRFDSVARGGGPALVSLEAGLGIGKTRLVQELYSELAASRQSQVAYWPPSLRSDADVDVLRSRKRVEPLPGWTVPGGAPIPWLWWGIECHRSQTGSPMRALKDNGDQLRVHLDPLLSVVQRSSRRKEDALEVLSGVFDLVGVISPGAAVEAGGKFLGVWRRKRDAKKQAQVVAMDRRIDAQTESYEDALRLGAGLVAVAGGDVPVILVIDDAPWADPGTVGLMRFLLNQSAMPIFVLTTSWPELLSSQKTDAATFGGLLAELERTHRDRVERITVTPLGDADLSSLVLETAPRTPATTAAAIATRASGNPLTLNLILDLEIIKRDIASDQCIDTDPELIDRLPSDLRVLYQQLWGQLPDQVTRVLAIAAVQGSEFLAGAVEEAATALGFRQEAIAGLDAAQHVYGWLREVNPHRYEFSERQRFEIANDVLHEIFSPEDHQIIRVAIIRTVLALKATARWHELDLATRRLALETHLELNEQLGLDVDRDLAAIADSMLQLALIELDAGNASHAVDVAQRAYDLHVRIDADEVSSIRARAALGQALALAGRSADAIAVLSAVADSTEIAAAAELTDELRAEVAADDADDAPVAVAEVEVDSRAATDEFGCEPFDEWTPREIGSLVDMRPSDVADLVCEVVAVEGPVLAADVYRALRSASGASREGARIRAALDRGVRAAIQSRQLVASSADADGRSELRVLRLPSQPEMRLRLPGPRTAWSTPSNEIVALARAVLDTYPDEDWDRAGLKTVVGAALGAQRHSQPLDDLLENVLPPSMGTPPALVPETARPTAAPVDQLADEYGRIAWVGWTPRKIPWLVDLAQEQCADLIREVVEAEGPVMVQRIFEVLRTASGASRLGAAIRASLERGLERARREGIIIVTTEGIDGHGVARTLAQEPVVLRTPGDRSSWRIPPSEIVELARRVQERDTPESRDELKRQLSKALGWSHYTRPLDELLESVLPAELGSPEIS